MRQLLAPLRQERDRGEHQRAPHQPAQDVLLEDEPGLDRLSEADLVGQERAAAHLAQHPQDGPDLEVVALQVADAVQAEEALEPAGQREPLGVEVEQETCRAVARRVLDRRGRRRSTRDRPESALLSSPATRWRSGAAPAVSPARLSGRRLGRLLPDARVVRVQAAYTVREGHLEDVEEGARLDADDHPLAVVGVVDRVPHHKPSHRHPNASLDHIEVNPQRGLERHVRRILPFEREDAAPLRSTLNDRVTKYSTPTAPP